MERVQEILDLSVVPHFTTLQKFLCRIKTLFLRITFRKTVNLFYSNDNTIPVTAIDSSGFTSGYCSHYFSERTGKIRKHFLKTSISVDTDHQVITAGSSPRKAGPTIPDMPENYFDNVTISEHLIIMSWIEVHRLIREDLIADSIIPLRSWNIEVIDWYIPKRDDYEIR